MNKNKCVNDLYCSNKFYIYICEMSKSKSLYFIILFYKFTYGPRKVLITVKNKLDKKNF